MGEGSRERESTDYSFAEADLFGTSGVVCGSALGVGSVVCATGLELSVAVPVAGATTLLSMDGGTSVGWRFSVATLSTATFSGTCGAAATGTLIVGTDTEGMVTSDSARFDD